MAPHHRRRRGRRHLDPVNEELPQGSPRSKSQSPAMTDWHSRYHRLSPMTSMLLSQPWLMCPTAWMCEEAAAGVRRRTNNRG